MNIKTTIALSPGRRAMRDLRATLALSDLVSGRCPEWQVHLAAAQCPGLMTEAQILAALGVVS